MLKTILISVAFTICLAIVGPIGAQYPGTFRVSRIDFTLVAEDHATLQEYAPKIDKMVKDITRKWLDEPIPRGMRQTTIHIYHRSYNKAYCTLTDHPVIFIYSNGEHLDQTLKHELTHALLMIRYPDLPRWTHEGVASSWDGPGHQARYAAILNWSRKSGTYPKLAEIMQGVRFNARNTTAYTASNSLVKFLLHHSDRYTLFLYSTGRCTLERAYGYRSKRALREAWIEWLNAPCVAQKPAMPVSARKP